MFIHWIKYLYIKLFDISLVKKLGLFLLPISCNYTGIFGYVYFLDYRYGYTYSHWLWLWNNLLIIYLFLNSSLNFSCILFMVILIQFLCVQNIYIGAYFCPYKILFNNISSMPFILYQSTDEIVLLFKFYWLYFHAPSTPSNMTSYFI